MLHELLPIETGALGRSQVVRGQVATRADVRLDDPLAPRVAQLVLLTGSPISQEARAWLDEWWDDCVRVASSAGIALLPTDYRQFERMSAAESRSLHGLPLD